jgi:hypothetical protein
VSAATIASKSDAVAALIVTISSIPGELPNE